MSPNGLRFDTRQLMRRMGTIERQQLPYATMLALNETVKGARVAVQQEMNRVFDRPTPFAKRGVVYERAQKTDFRASVVLYGSRSRGGLPPAAFLGPQIEGGMRSLKSFEKQLVSRGMMPQGRVAVPAAKTQLNRYGNVTQGFLNRVMADLQVDYRGAGATRARTDQSLKRNRHYKQARFFVPKRGSQLYPGVYQRDPRNQKIFPVLLFVPARAYRKLLQFHEVVARYAEANLAEHFARAFDRAMATARR
ncbi:hypothetical protein [Georhizobium sp. MAB10]|uniref:hypothetical protein n=1 Tax=Georhizobium sp. MAB10 TaxID=3028319 RepID=UPI003855EFBF